MYFKIVNGAVDFNDHRILEQVNLEIKEGEHIAIVGRNGAGKSTILKALIDPSLFCEGIGEEKLLIQVVGNPMIGFLKQNEGFIGSASLLDEILKVYQPILDIERKIQMLEEKMRVGTIEEKETYLYVELQENYKNMGGYEYKKEYLNALFKNGFQESDFNRPISSFSGGEQTKIQFIQLLLSKPDLLLLDEPTNHLDLEGILWLEEYLKNYSKAFVLVSHDRMFLDQTVQKIYEIEYGETTLYHGNYEFYVQEKKRRFEIQSKNYERQQKEIARLQRIADRFRGKPSKASMALSKLKQIERMEKVQKPEKENKKTFQIKYFFHQESGRIVLNVDHLQFGYSTCMKEACFTLEKGRRLGIVGANGTGKSTFLKTIMGILPSFHGTLEFGRNVTIAYFDQQFDDFDLNLTVYQEFQKKFPDRNDFEIRSSLASFLFYEEDVYKKIGVLSGGEKVRLRLCEVVFSQANFLILDEPTNHLDLLSKEKLETVLQDYPGTILFVSHDRYFMKKIADSILDFSSQSITYYDYGYEDYLEKQKEKTDINMSSKKEKRIKEKNKKEIKIDTQIRKLEEKYNDLKEQLFLEEVYMNPLKYQEIEEKMKNIEEQLNALMLD